MAGRFKFEGMVKLLVVALAILTVNAMKLEKPFLRDADPVRLAAYYETRCPDSKRWAKDQLGTTYPLLKDIMDVDINAYGKAKVVETPDGSYLFDCQHGHKECEGNMMLACAKKYLATQEDYVDFNICVMSTEEPPDAGPECAQQLGLPYDDIATCSSSDEGKQLLYDIGVKQSKLEPPLDYVPWMVEGGEHTEYIQQQAEHNLTMFVCSEYQGTPPDACTSLV